MSVCSGSARWVPPAAVMTAFLIRTFYAPRQGWCCSNLKLSIITEERETGHCVIESGGRADRSQVGDCPRLRILVPVISSRSCYAEITRSTLGAGRAWREEGKDCAPLASSSPVCGFPHPAPTSAVRIHGWTGGNPCCPAQTGFPEGGRIMRQRHTRIIATLGPATCSVEMIRQLICAGADVFRINASHAVNDTISRYVQAVREASEKCSAYAGVLLDLQGPKIRLGAFQGGSACLRNGESFRITTDDILGTDQQSSTTYRDFVKDVRAGDKVLLADGAVELVVVRSDGTASECRVVRGGVVSRPSGNQPSRDRHSAPLRLRKRTGGPSGRHPA